MTVDTRTETRDGTRFRTLWASVLLGPSAALLGLELAYALTERACARGQMLPVHLTYVAGLALTLLAALLGWKEWRRWGGGHAIDEAREERSRFLATLGVISGSISALIIVAQWSAMLFLHPCQ
jgi:hypothetical protein